MIVSALPVQVWAVNGTLAANIYFSFTGEEKWQTNDTNVDYKYTNGSFVFTETTGSSDGGFLYYELPDNIPTEGTVDLSFTYTFSVSDNSMRSSFALINELPTDKFELNDIQDLGFGVGKNGDEIRVIHSENDNYFKIPDSDNGSYTHRIEAIIDYDNDKVSYTVYDENNNTLDKSNEDTADFTAKYLHVYVRENARITISDFVIKAEGATPPTDEPTEAPVETKDPVVTDTPGENDSDFIYNLDTDGRDNKGWTTDSASGTAGGGSVSYNNDQLTLTNTAQGDRSQAVDFQNVSDIAEQVKIDLTLTMTADKDGDVGTASGAYTHFKLTDTAENDILALMLGNDGIGGKESTLYLNVTIQVSRTPKRPIVP